MAGQRLSDLMKDIAGRSNPGCVDVAMCASDGNEVLKNILRRSHKEALAAVEIIKEIEASATEKNHQDILDILKKEV